jgi:hypothetical protein
MTIPGPVMAVAVDVLTETYTWAQLDVLFAGAGAPGDSPLGSSKAARSIAWLRRVNVEMPDAALDFLGRLLHNFMEEVLSGEESWTDALEGFVPHPANERDQRRARMKLALERAGLSYIRGGFVSQGGAHVVVRQLHDHIRSRDLPAVEAELEGLAQRAATHPRDALSAAANIVEAVLGEMVAAYGLTPPANRTLNTMWTTLKPAINADPEIMPDPDLRKIVGAMAALVDGLQGLRDDKSRAHAMRPELARAYRIKPRHARLAVNAALALVVFLLEVWEAKRGRR